MRTQISCPNCGAAYTADIHQVVDVGRQPAMKQALLSGQLNVAVCPNCGVGGRISTPLLYHDPKHELFMVYIPQEMNLDQVRREEMIGRLVQQFMNGIPAEQRRGYMLQPQTMLTMASFMERVWETEGVTPEMLARQQQQADLLQRLINASPDVADFLIKERAGEIDETLFLMLRAQIDAVAQTNDQNRLVPLVNLQAKLMTETPVGRELEKRQLALHALNRDAKKQGALTPNILLKHILANQDDEALVNAIALTGQTALTYEFFGLLTAEIDRQEKAKEQEEAAKLTAIRERLLVLQDQLQKASEQVLQDANQTLDAILAAEDRAAAVDANLDRIDEAFMHVLEARMIHAEQARRKGDLDALMDIQRLIIERVQGEAPPEITLLNGLLLAESAEERQRILDEQADLLSPELLDVVGALQGQARDAGQAELANRLGEIRRLLEVRA